MDFLKWVRDHVTLLRLQTEEATNPKHKLKWVESYLPNIFAFSTLPRKLYFCYFLHWTLPATCILGLLLLTTMLSCIPPGWVNEELKLSHCVQFLSYFSTCSSLLNIWYYFSYLTGAKSVKLGPLCQHTGFFCFVF